MDRLNPYPYALNSPVNRVDPTGLASEMAGMTWDERLLEELLFQDCFKLVLVTSQLILLAFLFGALPLAASGPVGGQNVIRI